MNKKIALILLLFTIRLFPQNVYKDIEYAWKLVESGKFNEAHKIFIKSLKTIPEDAWLNRAVGWILSEKLGKPEESIVYFDKAIQINSNEQTFFLELAHAFRYLKKYDKFIENYKKAIVVFENKKEKPPEWIYNVITEVFRNEYKFPEKALPYIEDGLVHYPDSIDLTLNKALIYDDLKELDNAIKYFEKTLSLHKSQDKTPASWLLLTVASYYLFHLKEKNYDRALTILEEAIDEQNNVKDKDTARDWICYGLYHKKDYDKYIPLTEEYIQTGLSNDAKSAHADRLANLFFNQGNFEKTKKYAEIVTGDFWLKPLFKEKTITLNAHFRLNKIMKDYFPYHKKGEYIIPLPINTIYQTLLSVKSKPEYKKLEKDGRYNLLYFDFTGGYPETLELTFSIKMNMVSINEQAIESITDKNDPLYEYAYLKNDYYDIDNPIIKDKTNEIVKSAKNDYEKVKLIHQWVSENVRHILNIKEYQSYDKNGNLIFDTSKIPEYKKVSEIMISKIGHCHHISDLFIGMVRTQNIPVDKIWGIAISADTNIKSGTAHEHYTVELFDKNKKEWFYVEPQDKKFFGTNQFWHIILSSTELEKKYTNFIDITFLQWAEFYYYGNPDALIFKVEYY